MKPKRKKRLLLLLGCYALAVLIWLAVSGILLLRGSLRAEGAMAPRALSLADCSEVNGVLEDTQYQEGQYIYTASGDPQLIWDFEGGAPVGLLLFDATATNRAPGEMLAFYTTAPGQPFSIERKVWGRQTETGGWVFDLGGKTVHRLRLDPGATGVIYWELRGITLNAPKPAAAYFALGSQGVALLLLLPLLAWAVLCEGLAFVGPMLDKRRFDRRWEAVNIS